MKDCVLVSAYEVKNRKNTEGEEWGCPRSIECGLPNKLKTNKMEGKTTYVGGKRAFKETAK